MLEGAMVGRGKSTSGAAAILIMAAMAGDAQADSKSVYTSIAQGDCLLYLKEPKGEGRVCAGEAGYNLVLTEFDDRAALELVRAEWPQNAILPISSVAPDFSWFAGEAAEWRMGAKAPFAMILRIGVAPTRKRPSRPETRLLVVKLPPEGEDAPCLVGAVAGWSGANEAARAVADQAHQLPCLK